MSAAVVSLRELVGEVEACITGLNFYLNRLTGEVHGGSDEDISILEDNEGEEIDRESWPEWQIESMTRLKEVLSSSDWLPIPAPSSRESYNLMVRYAEERCADPLCETLLVAIRGKGAFARFKDLAETHGVLDD